MVAQTRNSPQRAKVEAEESRDDNQLKEKKSVAQTSSSKKKKDDFDYQAYFMLFVIICVTIFAHPSDLGMSKTVKLSHVFYYGWITCVSTGVGVLPFFFFNEPDQFWMAVSNAVAGGMMLSASYSLAYEGSLTTNALGADFGVLSYFGILEENQALCRTFGGVVTGIVFILVMQRVLASHEDLKVGEFGGATAQKMILIVFVMTLHSLSEGIGIGVSFGGERGNHLGQFISLSLAVHNVPEGLAVALVLLSRKVSKIRTILWAIFTSFPQPLMAIPAFLFVEKFAPLLPLGLGFAAGAMTYVAIFELLAEAINDSSLFTTAIVGTASCVFMTFLQNAVKEAV